MSAPIILCGAVVACGSHRPGKARRARSNYLGLADIRRVAGGLYGRRVGDVPLAPPVPSGFNRRVPAPLHGMAVDLVGRDLDSPA